MSQQSLDAAAVPPNPWQRSDKILSLFILLGAVFLLSPRAGVCDTFESGVWEPTINKRNSLRSATEAACLILSIDETVKNPQVRPFPFAAHPPTPNALRLALPCPP